jgi:hypothetical protein
MWCRKSNVRIEDSGKEEEVDERNERRKAANTSGY